jgi:uncharacterized protein YdeI (YjbR/CyaY-like superfamily)
VTPRYFATPNELRAWLQEHHATADELWVGFYKKGSGRPSISWPEAVDEALCFGWVDSIRKRIDEERYVNRFTPRKPNRTWSAKNVRRFEELASQRRVRAAGRRAFEQRRLDTTGTYSYEQRHAVRLPAAFERRFRAKEKAWTWFQAQPEGYRASALFWVMSAKKPETRERRFGTLIDDSGRGRRVPPLRPRSG